jgi:hypothetical protein
METVAIAVRAVPDAELAEGVGAPRVQDALRVERKAVRKAKVDDADVLETAPRAHFLREEAVADLKVGLDGGLMNGSAHSKAKLAIEVDTAHECRRRVPVDLRVELIGLWSQLV